MILFLLTWAIIGLSCFTVARLLWVTGQNLFESQFSFGTVKSACDVTNGVVVGAIVSLFAGPVTIVAVFVTGMMCLVHMKWDRQLFNICDFFKRKANLSE